MRSMFQVKRRSEAKFSSSRFKEQAVLIGMCLIPAAVVFAFNYLPMFGLVLAFKDFRYDQGILGSDWAGFKNFEFLFTSGTLWRMLRNTVGMNLLFIVVQTLANVGVAMLLYDLTSARKIKVYQTCMMLPYFISWVIGSYIVYTLLNPQQGVLNQIIQAFGGEPISWYREPVYWPFILLIAHVWKGVGMGCIIYYASLMGNDSAYSEAAAIDGATSWQIKKHVLFPSLLPVIVIQTILSIGSIMHADFGLFYQVPRDMGTLYSVTDVFDTFTYRALRINGDVSMSAAAGFFQSITGCILVCVTNYIVTKIEPDYALF